MSLTKSQLAALKRIHDYIQKTGLAFHKEKASGTVYAVRANVLEKLEKSGMIISGTPFAFAYHRVTVTEDGIKAINANTKVAQ